MLGLSVDKNNDISLYIQVYKQIKEKIIRGKLKAETKLPPIRMMANFLDINPATVVKSYDLLKKENLIYQKVGSGTYVMERPLSHSIKNNEELELLDYGQIKLNNHINFASATPGANLFPVDDFKYVLNKILDRDGGEAFTYQKSQGYYPLRESIMDYLFQNDIITDINSIQIVSGAQQAIDLLSKILIDFEDSILISEYTYSGAINAFRARETKMISIPIEIDGMDLDRVEEIVKNREIKFVFVMTSFQNPSGISWSIEKKKRLIQLAERYNFYIIEDDCLSELYYNGEKNGANVAIKSLDKEDRVIYIKSFSKIFMPGLRLAFLVLPEKLMSPILAAKYATDISSSGLNQRVFDFYLREGLWIKHLNKMNKIFSERFKNMKRQIKFLLPDEITLVYEPEGGLYFWLSLPEGKNSEKFYLKALENKIAFLPGNVFTIDNKINSFFRLSFAALEEEEIKIGIKRLADIAKDFLGNNENKGYTPLL